MDNLRISLEATTSRTEERGMSVSEVTESSIKKLTIRKANGLDPIGVVFEDFSAGQGKVTIECFGEAWSHYWGAMGDSDVMSFFRTCGNDYLTNKLIPGTTTVLDWEEISKATGKTITNEVEAIENEEAMSEAYGSDWRMDLPRTDSNEYRYLCKIIDAIKEAIRQ